MLSLAVAVVSGVDEAVVQIEPEQVGLDPGAEFDPNLLPFYPYPDPELRNLGGGLGFNLGPLGAGAAAGLGPAGFNFGAGAGFSNKYQYYGTPGYYKQYYSAR